MGIKDIVVGSNGLKSGNSNIHINMRKACNAQKDLSRKKKGSSNRGKQRIKVAKIHSKIRNSRKDFLHKLSTDIVRKNSSGLYRGLKHKRMVKNRKLSKSISDSSWGSLVNFLEYNVIGTVGN